MIIIVSINIAAIATLFKIIMSNFFWSKSIFQEYISNNSLNNFNRLHIKFKEIMLKILESSQYIDSGWYTLSKLTYIYCSQKLNKILTEFIKLTYSFYYIYQIWQKP